MISLALQIHSICLHSHSENQKHFTTFEPNIRLAMNGGFISTRSNPDARADLVRPQIRPLRCFLRRFLNSPPSRHARQSLDLRIDREIALHSAQAPKTKKWRQVLLLDFCRAWHGVSKYTVLNAELAGHLHPFASPDPPQNITTNSLPIPCALTQQHRPPLYSSRREKHEMLLIPPVTD